MEGSSKFTVGPMAQAAADAAREGQTPYPGAGAPSWPPKDIPSAMPPAQNSFLNPQNIQTPPKPFSGYLPPQKPKFSIPFGKIFSWIIFLAIIAGCIWVFSRKDELFGSAWAREMRAEQAKYNISAGVFEEEFNKIEMDLALEESGVKAIEDSLKKSKENLTIVERDLIDFLYAADKGAEGKNLSLKDRKAQSDYLTCLTARKNAADLLSKGISMATTMVKAQYPIIKYQKEVPIYNEKLNGAFILMRLKDDEATIAAILELQKSSTRMKNYLTEIYQILGLSIFQEQAGIYTNLNSAFSDLAAAYERHDISLLNKASEAMKIEGDHLAAIDSEMTEEVKKYVAEYTDVNINRAAQSLIDIEPICTRAEKALEPRIDIAKIKKSINM